MMRYGRAGICVCVCTAALVSLACSDGRVTDATATPVPPVQQVAGEFSAQELLPPSRRGIAPALQDDAVTHVAVTPTPRPAVSEALAQRIAEQWFNRPDNPFPRDDLNFIGAFLTTRQQLIASEDVWGTRFPVSGSGSSTDQFWVVNFIEDGPVNLPADFAGAVVDAESGLVVNSFFQISVPPSPPRVP